MKMPDSTIDTPANQATAARFYNEALTNFAAARANTKDVHELFYRIAGKTVQITVVGHTYEYGIVRALEHLRIAPDECDQAGLTPGLHIYCWDSRSTAGKPLKSPWTIDDFSPFGQIYPCSSGQYRAAFEADACALSMIDLNSNVAFYWAPDWARIPNYSVAVPYRAIFSWYFHNSGMEIIHASAVSNSNGGLILTGKNGSGKSNTGLACLSNNLSYLADDHCLISNVDGYRIHSIYSSAKLWSKDVVHFPALNLDQRISTGQLKDPAVDKHVFYLNEHWPNLICRSVPLKAIVLPRVTKEGINTLVPGTYRDAFVGLIEQSHLLPPFATESSIAFLAKLARAVPVYKLSLSSIDWTPLLSMLEGLMNTDRE
ncbi:MAG: hypothetical protein K2W95_20700 [Candidatus Obscuribacterales bacterium]|nr:hypothetical protein [Candidatus Obscuribacterales bacterium]